MISHFLTAITQLVQLVPLHMGKLHAYEQYLVFGIAFGPFLILGIVVFIVRRRDIAEEESDSTDEEQEDPEVSSTHPRAT